MLRPAHHCPEQRLVCTLGSFVVGKTLPVPDYSRANIIIEWAAVRSWCTTGCRSGDAFGRCEKM